eukprot:CAMPEP_0184707152 /NCGR_PEP_ID=MMETSP0313-20130426/37125_1 /TAXON_ID=2792 /ORGANISM="Porphyridium aerugineum, Strain SAG 1380-2" /LENGTH=1065 /DNA_ID=CAMNT_0027168725 /DNA_START=921 /DNA_END=4118 /DNA_ORIENTATION=-
MESVHPDVTNPVLSTEKRSSSASSKGLGSRLSLKNLFAKEEEDPKLHKVDTSRPMMVKTRDKSVNSNTNINSDSSNPVHSNSGGLEETRSEVFSERVESIFPTSKVSSTSSSVKGIPSSSSATMNTVTTMMPPLAPHSLSTNDASNSASNALGARRLSAGPRDSSKVAAAAAAIPVQRSSLRASNESGLPPKEKRASMTYNSSGIPTSERSASNPQAAQGLPHSGSSASTEHGAAGSVRSSSSFFSRHTHADPQSKDESPERRSSAALSGASQKRDSNSGGGSMVRAPSLKNFFARGQAQEDASAASPLTAPPLDSSGKRSSFPASGGMPPVSRASGMLIPSVSVAQEEEDQPKPLQRRSSFRAFKPSDAEALPPMPDKQDLANEFSLVYDKSKTSNTRSGSGGAGAAPAAAGTSKANESKEPQLSSVGYRGNMRKPIPAASGPVQTSARPESMTAEPVEQDFATQNARKVFLEKERKQREALEAQAAEAAGIHEKKARLQKEGDAKYEADEEAKRKRQMKGGHFSSMVDLAREMDLEEIRKAEKKSSQPQSPLSKQKSQGGGNLDRRNSSTGGTPMRVSSTGAKSPDYQGVVGSTQKKSSKFMVIQQQKAQSYSGPALLLAPYGSVGHGMDLLAIPHNAIRNEMKEVFYVLSVMERMFTNLRSDHIDRFLEYWAVSEAFIRAYIQYENSIFLPCLFDIKDMEFNFKNTGFSELGRRALFQDIINAFNGLDDLMFGGLDYISPLEQIGRIRKAITKLTSAILNYFVTEEKLVAPILTAKLKVTDAKNWEDALFEFLTVNVNDEHKAAVAQGKENQDDLEKIPEIGELFAHMLIRWPASDAQREFLAKRHFKPKYLKKSGPRFQKEHLDLVKELNEASKEMVKLLNDEFEGKITARSHTGGHSSHGQEDEREEDLMQPQQYLQPVLAKEREILAKAMDTDGLEDGDLLEMEAEENGKPTKKLFKFVKANPIGEQFVDMGVGMEDVSAGKVVLQAPKAATAAEAVAAASAGSSPVGQAKESISEPSTQDKTEVTEDLAEDDFGCERISDAEVVEEETEETEETEEQV